MCGIAWKNMMEIGRGGACVPARVAPQGRIHRSVPHTHNTYIFGMETPLRERSGGHAGTAPTVSCGQIARGCPLPSVLGHLFMCKCMYHLMSGGHSSMEFILGWL